ncbi:MAG TPA: glutaredoxin family protein, partial [Bacteroidota bacterium]|nr:glutaredoxin family protein [Bacteroidota bacterium]
MILVEVYSKNDCHLCDVAKDQLKRIQQQHPFELKVISIEHDDGLFQKYKERIPVIHINGTFAFQYRIREQ